MSETREAILNAARDLYLAEGLAGLSMRKIARATGVTATAIYHHFDDKEAVLINLVVRASHIFLEFLSRGLHGKTPLQRLQMSGDGYLEFALEHPGYYRIMFMAPKEDHGLVRLNEQAQADFAPTFTFLVDRVRECMEAEVLAEDDPEKVSAMIWANCHGLVALRLCDHLAQLNNAQFRGLFRESTNTLLKGLS